MTAGGKVDVAVGCGRRNQVSSVTLWRGARAQGGVPSWTAGMGLGVAAGVPAQDESPGPCSVAAEGGGRGPHSYHC